MGPSLVSAILDLLEMGLIVKVSLFLFLIYLFIFNNVKDKNECKGGSHNCNVNANCTNVIGSFTCECDIGFKGNGITCEGD